MYIYANDCHFMIVYGVHSEQKFQYLLSIGFESFFWKNGHFVQGPTYQSYTLAFLVHDGITLVVWKTDADAEIAKMKTWNT